MQSETRRKLLQLQALSRQTLAGDHDARRLCGCGYRRTAQVVELRGSELGAVVARGLQTCGSVWSCPRCAPRVQHERRAELSRVLSGARAQGDATELWTFTIPHSSGDELVEMRKAVAAAWRSVTQGRGWVATRKAIGLRGYVRALEATHGRAGWHPHLHVVAVVGYELPQRMTTDELRHVTPDAMALVVAARRAAGASGSELGRWRARNRERLAEHEQKAARRPFRRGLEAPQSREGLRLWLWARWARAVARHGLGRPSFLDGLDLRSCDAASEYVTKMGLGWEMTAPGSKVSRGASRTPQAILAACSKPGAGASRAEWSEWARSRALWREWSLAMRGARQLTWAPGLRKRYGLGAERDDAKIADDATGASVLAVAVSAPMWDGWLRDRPSTIAAVCDALVRDDPGDVAASLRDAPQVAGWSWTMHEDVDAAPRDDDALPPTARDVRRAWISKFGRGHLVPCLSSRDRDELALAP